MKVIYSTEKGKYLDSKASHVFFAPANDFFEAPDYDSLFLKLDNDPNLFGVVPIDDSIRGENTYILEKLLTGKYKVFGEVFLSPRLHLVSQTSLKLSEIKEVHMEIATKEFCAPWLEKNKEIKVIIEDDISPQLQSEDHNECAFIVLESQIKGLKVKYISKNIGSHIAGALRYFIIGRTFFDMPSEKSDKVIVVFRTNTSKDLELIEQVLSKKGLSIFKLISKTTEGKDEVEYYAEFGFYGLLDLQELEMHSLYINLLGIIESGEFFVI